MNRIGMYLLTFAVCGLPISAGAVTGKLDFETVINEIPKWTVVFSFPSEATPLQPAIQTGFTIGGASTEILEHTDGFLDFGFGLPNPVRFQ